MENEREIANTRRQRNYRRQSIGPKLEIPPFLIVVDARAKQKRSTPVS